MFFACEAWWIADFSSHSPWYHINPYWSKTIFSLFPNAEKTASSKTSFQWPRKKGQNVCHNCSFSHQNKTKQQQTHLASAEGLGVKVSFRANCKERKDGFEFCILLNRRICKLNYTDNTTKLNCEQRLEGKWKCQEVHKEHLLLSGQLPCTRIAEEPVVKAK